MRGKEHRLVSHNYKLRNSLLGWLITSPISSYSNLSIQCNHAVTSTSLKDDLVNEYLPKLWDLEELPQETILSDDDKLRELHFITNTVRKRTGRFCVKLPINDSPDCLGNSYNSAKERLSSL